MVMGYGTDIFMVMVIHMDCPTMDQDIMVSMIKAVIQKCTIQKTKE
jgi:glycosyltransferase A (GT-A) superfamily protein (DUF2064 family)